MGTPTDVLGGALGVATGQATLNGITGAIGGAASASYNREMQKADQKWQEHMRATQYQTTVKDMKAAGLNPAVALSGGAATSSQGGGSSGSGTNVNMGGIDLSSILGTISTTALTQAQKENIKADTDLKNEQAGKTKTEVKAIEIDNEIKKIMSVLDAAYTQAKTKTEYQNIEKAKKEIAKYEKEMAEIDANIEKLIAEKKFTLAKRETEKRLQKGIQTREWIKTISSGIADLASVASF